MIRVICTFVIVIAGAFSPLFSQEGPIKSFGDTHSERKFCLYPSTLRMINFEQNEEVNDWVNGIRKILIYQLSADANYPELSEAMNKYRSAGFEEYAQAFGGDRRLLLLGKEGRKDTFTGFAGADGSLYAFYITGSIRWEKIPIIIRQFQSNQLLNVFEFEPPEIDD